MLRATMMTGLALLGGILAFSAASASAEFKSLTEATKGKGSTIEMTLEAGGGTVVCQAFSESSSLATWTIHKEGKSATAGPDLLLNIEKWGECHAKSSELKEIAAEVSGCEWETIEPATEVEVKAKVITACTIKVATCEVAIEPKGNESLSSVALRDSGEKDEDLILDPTIKNLTTVTKGICPGIKASKEGVLKGEAEALQIQPGDVSEFTISASRPFLREGANNAILTIRRIGGTAGMGTFGEINDPPTAFLREEPAAKECRERSYSAFIPCSYKLSYNKAIGAGRSVTAVWGASGIEAVVTVRGF